MNRSEPTTEPARIVRQIEQAFDGGAWHGPSVREILAGVDARVAAAQRIPGGHSIWEIVLHLVSTQRTLLRRLDGDASAMNLSLADEWPNVIETTDAAWAHARDQLIAGDLELRDRIAAFPPDRLDEPLIPGGSSAYNNLHGYIQHNLYHAAQIGLLKKWHDVSHAPTMLRRSIPEITLAENDLPAVTRFFVEVLGFEKSTYTYDEQGERDPVVRHGDIEIRFRRYHHSQSPTRLSPTGVVIECNDCDWWTNRMRAKGLEPVCSHDVGQPMRVEYWINDGVYVAFEQPELGCST